MEEASKQRHVEGKVRALALVLLSLDEQQKMVAGFLWTFDQSHTLNSCMIHLEQKYCLHFQFRKKYGTEKRTDHYTCISLLAERTHECSVTPVLMELCQQFPSMSHALENNCASSEPHGNSALELQSQVIHSSYLNSWTLPFSFLLFAILPPPTPTTPPLLYNSQEE